MFSKYKKTTLAHNFTKGLVAKQTKTKEMEGSSQKVESKNISHPFTRGSAN